MPHTLQTEVARLEAEERSSIALRHIGTQVALLGERLWLGSNEGLDKMQVRECGRRVATIRRYLDQIDPQLPVPYDEELDA
jgi:hypothetical protein